MSSQVKPIPAVAEKKVAPREMPTDPFKPPLQPHTSVRCRASKSLRVEWIALDGMTGFSVLQVDNRVALLHDTTRWKVQ